MPEYAQYYRKMWHVLKELIQFAFVLGSACISF